MRKSFPEITQDSSERSTSGNLVQPHDSQGFQGFCEAKEESGAAEEPPHGTDWNENRLREVSLHGSLERPDDAPRLSAPALQAPAELSSSGHSIDPDHVGPPPAPVQHNVGWYRREAERFGDLAFDMTTQGEEDLARGAAIMSAHYGRIALELYAARTQEVLAAWAVKDHPCNFILGMLIGIPLSTAMWVGIIAVACR
jgi:hypothetical protein